MLVRFSEVFSVLALVTALIGAKHIPMLDFLPLSQITGIVCFSFAIFVSLRIFQAELQRIRAND